MLKVVSEKKVNVDHRNGKTKINAMFTESQGAHKTEVHFEKELDEKLQWEEYHQESHEKKIKLKLF